MPRLQEPIDVSGAAQATRTISLRLTEDDFRLVSERCAEHGLSRSDYIRQMVRADAVVGEALSEKEEAEILRAAVDELPEHLRAVVVFRYYEDLTVPEMAQALSLPEGTVKSRLHEAKRRIRARIARTIRPDASSNEKES